jgi:hypothetical protein
VLKFNGTTYPRVEDNVILTWRAVVASYFSDAVIRASPGVRRDGVNIHGRVVDESGQPLSGVLVRGGPNNGLMRPDLKTDVDGMFSIDVDEALLRFSHEGYRPKTQTLKRSGEGARIELQPTDDLWRPPYCPAETPSLRGFTMGFSVPPGTRIERGSDVDYGIASLRFGKARLALGFGPTWSWGMPAGIFLKDVVELTERDIRFADDPDALVAEYRGTRSDGTRFRWIGKVAETIEYDHVTKDEADYFDRIIDTLCWIRPTPPPRRNP